MKKKKIILPIIIIFILIIIIGATYAVYTYTNTSSNKELLAGNIYLNYTGSTGINIQDAMPGADYSDYYEFTITGSNNYTKDIYYDVILLKGELPTGKTETNRISDGYLKFKLVEVNNSVETTLLTDVSYDEINNKKLYVSTVPASTSSYSKTYRLYMTISEDLTIGTNSDYSLEEWSTAFASVKVKVIGDFTARTADKSVNISTQNLINLAVSYSEASSEDFGGGLVAVNTNGTLYDETGKIREYRYSGLNVNNYVFLDTDGNGVQDDNEIWRIVGIFKNSDDEWNVKIMRNTILTNSELPATYTYNETVYKIRDSDTSSDAYWNVTNTATNYNDWTTAGLQYWLNDSSTGYWSTISSTAQSKVNTNYTYYLGNYKMDNVDVNWISDTTITAYTHERSSTVCSSSVTSDTYENGNCSIYYGNQATWSGAVALLYPSDYGYSANSSYWSETTLFDYNDEAASTSWMQQNTDSSISYGEWLLSPSSNDTYFVAIWYVDGNVYRSINSYFSVRPCLNLKADTVIDLDHTGDQSDPYILI